MNNYKKNKSLLERTHNYKSDMEHDACGVGLIASTNGKKTRKDVEYGIEALKAIRQKTNFELSEIKKIDLIVNPSYLTICNIDRPKTGLQAKFSFKLAAALAVSEYDTANLNTFSDDLCRLTSLNKLRDLVNVESDTEASESQTAVSVQLHTGKILKNTYDLSQDLSIQIKERKIRQKARSLIGDSLAMNLWKKLGLANQLPSTWIENNTL